jgi:hypothetical protein
MLHQSYLTQYIKTIDDLWLSAPRTFDHGFSGDSAVNLENNNEDDTLHRIICLLMYKSPISTIRLQLCSNYDMLISFPWNIQTLNLLELNIRVTDEILTGIITMSLPLKTIILTRAEVSDISLETLSLFCKELKDIVITNLPLNRRSRYQMLVDPKCALEISDYGMSKIMHLAAIKRVHISSLCNVSPQAYETEIIPKLTEISLTLSSKLGMSIENIEMILELFPGIEMIRLYLSTNNQCFSDGVISEDFILTIPRKFPYLKLLFLSNFDISKIDNETKLFTYYSMKLNCWNIDELSQRFRKTFPKTFLEIKH